MVTYDEPTFKAACEQGVIILCRSQEWFDGAMSRETEDPFNVYDEWLDRLGQDLEPVRKILGSVSLVGNDSIEHPPTSQDDYE